MEELSCDVAVIGGGTAGLSAERSARRAGASTLLIDDGFTGTTCATVGCMPSKLLIAAAEAAHAVRHAALFGIHATPAIDGRAVMARVRRERDAFAAATREEIGKLPAGIRIDTRAKFAGPTRLALADGRQVAAKAIVIATGAKPAIPEAFAGLGDRALTNETVFELDELPASLAVIGAGPLGLELAQAFARLGARVAVFDQADAPGHVADKKVAAALGKILSEELALYLDTTPEAERTDEGVRLRWDGGEATFDRLLVAAGRPPALGGLDLAAAGLALDDKGVPVFDRATMRCGSSAVFLAGDADADRPVLHEASAEGAIAGYNAANLPDVKPSRRATPFSIMFTDPPLAILGTPGDGDVTGEASYEDQGRAKVMGRNAGLARLHADPRDGRLTAATIFAPGAEHLAHLVGWAIEAGQTAADLLGRPFYHPTLEEGLKPALRAIVAQVPAPAPQDRDDGVPAGA